MLPIFSNVKYDRDTALALTRRSATLALNTEPGPKRLVPGTSTSPSPRQSQIYSVDKDIEKQSKVALKAYVLFNQPVCRDGVLSSRQE